jgi:hypothetical protein
MKELLTHASVQTCSRRREASQIRDLTVEQSGSRAAAIGQERAQGAPRPWTQRQDEEPKLQQPELGNGAKCAQGGCSKLHGARITAGWAPPDQTTSSTKGFHALCSRAPARFLPHNLPRTTSRSTCFVFDASVPRYRRCRWLATSAGFSSSAGHRRAGVSRVPSASSGRGGCVGGLPRPVPMLCYSRAGWDSVGPASTSPSPVLRSTPCICSCWMPAGGRKNTDLTAPAAFPVEICWSAAWKSDISTDLASLQRCTTGPPIRTARRAAVDDSAPRR